MMANIITKRYGRIKPPIGAVVDRGHPIGRSVIVAWLLNEGGGDQVGDASIIHTSSGYNGGVLYQMDPPTDWVQGLYGLALDFDGTNDYIFVGDSDLWHGGAFTWSFWLRASSLATHRAFMSKGPIGSSFSYAFQVRTDGSATFFLPVTLTDLSTYAYTSTGLFSINTWYHFVLVFYGRGVGNSGRFKFYADGASTSLTYVGTIGAQILNSTGAMLIGAFSGLGRYWSGLIDHVLIYNEALAEGDILRLYHEPFCMIKSPVRKSYFFVPAGNPWYAYAQN